MAFKLGFEPGTIVVPLDALMPVKTLRPTLKESAKYAQIAQSIKEIGLVEAPVVARVDGEARRYLLLDGHIRVGILKEMGRAEVECVVSLDDEAFTYNRNISRLSAVQERAMIVRAIERGVPEEKIAAAMSLDVISVKRRVKMLDGICQDVVTLLAEKHCPIALFDILRKMKPLRQLDAAELMVGSNNYSLSYAAAILAGTTQVQLVDGAKKKIKGATASTLARMERELANLQEAMGSIEESFSQDNLHLTVARGYIGKLISNPKVSRFMASRYPEFLEQFQVIADLTTTMPPETTFQ